ncbi:HYR domain-containing protein [Gelidibacter japonicus]|uniref:HYR domain-containing protein n=2 Tax=Gelidibacter japonicus TaxID=1962232 RepID=UPI0013D42FA8|nr:HYR domain-containing protein [Gelidibacter japonicus]
MKKHYTYVLQLVLLALFSGTSFHTNAASHSIIDPDNALYQLEWSFIKTLIDEDLERSFERGEASSVTVFNCPTSFSQNADPGTCSAVVTYALPTTDISGGSMVLVTSLGSGDTFPVGPTTVTYEERDNNNVATGQTCSFIVTVVDNEPPNLVGVPGNTTVECDAIPAAPTVTATDNCDTTLTVSYSEISNTVVDGVGAIVREWTVTDNGGNTVTDTQTITVIDSTDPILAGVPGDVTVQCDAIPAAPTVTATDNCDISLTVNYSETSNTVVDGVGTIVREWTVTDTGGNTTTGTQTITVVDGTPPALVGVPGNTTVECDAIPSVPTVTATDNCDISLNVNYSETSNTVVDGVGTIVREWTVTDTGGNTTTGTQTITVVDGTPPALVGVPGNTTVECDAIPSVPTVTATDNCDISLTVNYSETSNTVVNGVGTIVREWTVTDTGGNTTTGTQTITVVDGTPPALVGVPGNTTVECDAIPSVPTVTATDNCDISLTVNYSEISNTVVDGVGTIVREWTVTDTGGNTTTGTQTITVVDTNPPTFTSCPSNFNLSNDLNICGAVVNYTIPTATDNCGTAVVAQTDTSGLTSGSVFPIGITTIEYTATDANGLTSVCSFTVTVSDNELPTIDCPDDITVSADANCQVATLVLDAPTTDDNCAVASVSNNLAGMLPLPVGTHTVTWTVTDTAGLTATCDQTITVVDDTPPVITCPTPLASYDTDPDQCHSTLSFTATATDNCTGSPTISYEIDGNPISFPYNFPVGSTTVDVFAEDGDGLISTCSFVVNVEDNQPPIALCQPLTVTLGSTGNATITAEALNNGSSDACGGTLTYAASQTSFTCADIGTNNVTLTVTDANGNTSTCNTTVTVNDYIQNATATITSSVASPICSGTSVTFEATNSHLGLITMPDYQWYQNGSPVGTNSNTYTTTGLNNGDDVYVEITAGPCNTLITSNSITMTVSPLLPVSFNLNASANPACTGDSLNFFITDLINGGASPSYQWFLNGAPVGANSNSYGPLTTIVNGDIISVSVTSSATCASPVTVTETLTMTMNPLPTINALGNGNNVSTLTICEGESLTLTGSGGSTYTWDNGVVNNVSFTPAVGTHTYTVTGTNANGCRNTDTITVTVNPNTSITLVSASADQSVCRTGSAPVGTVENIDFSVFNATTVNVSGLPAGVTGVYNAALNRVRISGNPNDSVSGTFPYTITATNSCNTVTSTGVITVYYETPSTPGAINGPSSFLCPVSTAIYYVENDPNVETYEWSVPSTMTITSGQGTNQIEVAITGTVTFLERIRVRAHNPCGTSSRRDRWILINFAAPGIDAGNDIYVCEGTNIVTMAGDANGLSNTEWEWSDNGAGGTFSSVGTYDPPEYCIRWYWWGGCRETYDPPPRPLYAENSTYTLPSGAVAGDVITISLIADSGGFTWCDNIEDTMRIHILPNPTAEFVTTNAVCFGDSLTITGTPNTTVSYSFNGAAAGSFNIGGSGTVTFANQPAGLYELTSIQYTNPPNSNGVGCVNTITGEQVTINEPPTVTAPADITICAGETVNLSGASITGTNASGSWSTTGTGNFSGSVYTPSAGDINNGTVTLTYTNTPSDGVCPGVSDSMIVTINPVPTVNAGVDQIICSDSTITLNGSIGGGAISATWSASSGTFSDPNSLTSSYTPGITSGTVTLTLTANNPQGCGPVIDEVIYTINPASIANAGADLTVCNAGPIALNGSFSGTATSATWSSSTGGTFTPNANTMNATYNPSAADIAAGSVTLTLTSSNPAGVCSSGVDTVLFTFNESATADAGTNQTICSTQTLDLSGAIFGGSATSATWSSSGTPGTISGTTYTPSAADIANGSVTLTYTTNDPPGVCPPASDSIIVTIIPFVYAAASNTTAITSCSDTTLQLMANGNGTWSATPVTPGSVFSFSSTTDPNATFTGESGAEYTLTWTLTNPAPCAIDTDTFTVTLMDCEDNLTFNGIDNSVNFNNTYNLSGNFSIETWIKPNVINSNIQTILSKRNAGNLTTGYDLRLVDNNIQFYANNLSVSRSGITASRWYHIAVTFDGSAYRLYVDGLLVNNRTSTIGPAPNTANALLGAMSRPNNTPTNYYNGWMDEVRIWNTTLTVDQIRLMMNQEIEDVGGVVIGSTTGPLVSTGLNWSNLTAYYQMNRIPNVVGGNLLANVGVNGVLRNMTTQQPESAPVPYDTAANGLWTAATTWEDGGVLQIPHTNGINGSPVEWNIVRTSHNVSSNNQNIKVLGLIVEDNTLSIENSNPNDGQSLEVTKYLKIDGTLDLVGESQLLQPEGSIVDYTGTGYLERDQQGSGSLFNYNYWGSPVNVDGATYNLNDILFKATDPNNLQAITWTSGTNANNATNTMSSRWIYEYSEGLNGDHSAWLHKGATGSFNLGLGFTMKGSGAGNGSSMQNYTFVGQPNNGTITNTVTASPGTENQTLLGNPYPSAIDARLFIRDNIPGSEAHAGSTGSIDGSLTFWRQSTTNNSHYLRDYEGGYASLNLSGGTAATTFPGDMISGLGDAGNLTPGYFIPVAQGFFVTAADDTYQVTNEVVFRNSQRVFKKESSGESVFLRGSENQKRVANSTGYESDDMIQRVRLAFKTPEEAIRPLLLAFTPNNDATDGFDYGYDALNRDAFPSDMSFLIEGKKYIIQGVGAFDINKKYPLDMTLKISGNVELSLTGLENFDEDIDVYVHDSLLDTYTRINTVGFQANLEAGNYSGRFSIVFQPDTTLDIIDQDFKDISVKYLQKTDEIYVKTPASIEVRQVYLINIAGQAVRSWNMTNMNFGQEFKIPVKDISEGNYVLKVETNTNSYNKKVIIKF